MARIDKNLLIMRAQGLPEEKAKILLVFLLAYCNGNEQFIQGVIVGLRSLEKTGEVSPVKDGDK